MKRAMVPELLDSDAGTPEEIKASITDLRMFNRRFGGIRTTRSLLPPDVPVQVDGGIGPENIRAVRDAGASLFVAGSSIFGREDLPRAYRRLLQELA